MYPVRTPGFLKLLLPDIRWHFPRNQKVIYLTFDDGPEPAVTPQVLDLLLRYMAKATFFCIGSRVEQHPELYNRLMQEGHTTGNHSYSHPRGFRTPHAAYLSDIQKASHNIRSPLFRPPYGQLTVRAYRHLRRQYRIVMWDVLSGDFDVNRSPEQVAARTIRHIRPGSVVVFHDSIKAAPRMLTALEQVLEHFSREGFLFRCIEETDIKK